MASKDYQDLMDLLFKKKQQIKEIRVKFNGGDTKHTDISFIGAFDPFSSNETDVGNYALHLKHTIDSNGNYAFVAYKDLNQYFQDEEFLFKDEQPKVNRAYHDLLEGRYIFDFDPDELIEKFLLSRNRSSLKYSKLKSEHFHIAAHCMHAAKYALQQYEQLKSNTPGLESYYQAIDSVYIKAFRNDPNFVKNYLKQKTTNDFNLVNFITQVRALTKHLDLMKTIFARGGMQADHGIQLLLDSY